MLVHKPGGYIVLDPGISPRRRGAMDPQAWFLALSEAIFERKPCAYHAFIVLAGMDLDPQDIFATHTTRAYFEERSSLEHP